MTHPVKILVVDDEPDVESMFRQKFRKEIKHQQISFHFALCATEALTYLETSTAEASNTIPSTCTGATLILSDINMPGMNGLELLRVIKEKYPPLPVFMVSAYGDKTSEKTANDYGASGFINKPIDFNQLKQNIMGFTQSIPTA